MGYGGGAGSIGGGAGGGDGYGGGGAGGYRPYGKFYENKHIH